MSFNRIIKLVLLNAAIILINIVSFSPGIVGLAIGGESTFKSALGITIIIMDFLVFIVGNYTILNQKKGKMPTKEIKTVVDCTVALKEHRNEKIFKRDIEKIFEQMERLDKKKEIITDILLQKFSNTEMSYLKFQGVIDEINKIFNINIRSIINKLNIFDEEEYENIIKESRKVHKENEELLNEKLKIYEDYIKYIKDSINDNEEILLKLDKLLFELSKFDSLEDGELENMFAMEEIDDLINKAKFYKENS